MYAIYVWYKIFRYPSSAIFALALALIDFLLIALIDPSDVTSLLPRVPRRTPAEHHSINQRTSGTRGVKTCCESH